MENNKPLFMGMASVVTRMIFVLGVSIATTLTGNAQTKNESEIYHYFFQVSGVTNGASAKAMTDLIRPLFNTQEKPFGHFLRFDQVHIRFDFKSVVEVSEDQLKSVLAGNGMVLLNFSKLTIEPVIRDI